MNSDSQWRSLLRHARHIQEPVEASKRGAVCRATSSAVFMGGRDKPGHDDLWGKML
jgi:hypothetical protein